MKSLNLKIPPLTSYNPYNNIQKSTNKIILLIKTRSNRTQSQNFIYSAKAKYYLIFNNSFHLRNKKKFKLISLFYR